MIEGRVDREDVVVVGGGVAGLSCATTLARLGARVVLFEELSLGGELNTLGSVDDAPLRASVSGPDLGAELVNSALDVDVQLRFETVDRAVPADSGWRILDLEARALVLATGSEPDLDAVPGAADRFGRGVSVCSSCDGPLFRQRRVGVLGSGRDAARSVAELRAFASDVVWISTVAPPLRHRHDALLGSGAPVSVLEGVSVSGLDGDPLDTVVVAGADGERALELAGLFLVGPRRPRHPVIPGLVTDLISVDAAGRVAGQSHAWAIGDVRSGSSWSIAGAMGDAATTAWDIARVLGLVT